MKNSPSLAHLRRNRRMALREQIDAEKCLATISDVESVLEAEWRELNRQQVGALKLRLDSAFRKLAKILPDVKAVEYNPGEDADELTRERLIERITALHARAVGRLDGRGDPGGMGGDPSAATH